MEPIFKNPQFTSLLRVWKFITTYHDYLQLPEELGLISLYQLDEHVRSQKYKSTLISQLIKALVRKAKGHQKTNKNQQTAFFLAKNNKFDIFQDLLKSSAYELGHSQVNFSLVWKDYPQIDSKKPFEGLNLKEKYQYLSCLVSLVSSNSEFKQDYMQKLRKQHGQAIQQPGRDKIEMYQKFGVRLSSSYTLGIDSSGKCYVYVSKIGDSLLCFDGKRKQWTRIVGQQNISKQILQKLMSKPASITPEELDIMQGISDIWFKPGWTIEHLAFDRKKKHFNINERSYIQNKLQKLKLKFHSLDESYSKFISDCFNFRWASKQRRLLFHKKIDEAKEMNDLVSCLGDFFNETKHSIQRKINTLEFYHYNLDTKDVPINQFKHSFLHMNYLYSKGVVAESENSTAFTGTLYYHIKSFLAESESYEPYFYEYLMFFVESMLGIIEEMYPKQYQKRLKNLERMLEQKKEKQEQEEQKKKAQQKKATTLSRGRIKDKIRFSRQDESSSEKQSDTTAKQKLQLPSLKGRRLREKIRINYKAQNSKSMSKSIPAQKQMKRQANGKKQKKMKLDFDSDENEDEDISLSESDTQKEEKGLDLNNFKYDKEGQTQNFRRQLRSKGKN